MRAGGREQLAEDGMSLQALCGLGFALALPLAFFGFKAAWGGSRAWANAGLLLILMTMVISFLIWDELTALSLSAGQVGLWVLGAMATRIWATRLGSKTRRSAADVPHESRWDRQR